MEIIEGIHRIDEASSNLAHSNVYLAISGKELVVVDTGMSGNAKKIVHYIQKIGHQPSEVSAIVLTHYHMDHMGSVKELKDLTNAKVAVHVDDADFVAGKKPFPKPKNVLFRAVSAFIKPTPVDVDVLLNDGDIIGELTVVATPGHSPGSIALFDAQRRVLFSGDTLRFDGAKVTGAPEQYTWDAEKEKQSIQKISTLDFDIMLPGHGEILKADASKKVREFVDSQKKT